MKKHFTRILLLAVIAFIEPVITHAQVNVQDSLALVDLYDSTNGPHWVFTSPLNTWNLSTPVKYWTGVIVTNERVTSLFLLQDSLKGNIPSSLGNLTNLEVLNLSDNELSGAIPPSLENLISLKTLDLSNYAWPFGNQLSGTIPASLGSLINLQDLELHDNQLNGTIPASLGNLANLQILNLSDNNLEGSIPSSLGNLDSLRNLNLELDHLSGKIPASLGKLDSLKNLDLGLNELTGTIPALFKNLTNIQKLNLSYNQLSGSILPEIGNLSNLENLLLNYNQLTGTIPSSFKTLNNLQDLELNSNQLTGTIPSFLGTLTNLTHLYLSGNQLTGTITPELSNLTSLQYLGLDHNQLTGSIPYWLGNLSQLQYLSLEYNQLTDTIPPELGNLGKLESLIIGHNQLSGGVPSWLDKLRSLFYLQVEHNKLSGIVPSEFDSLKDLYVVRIDSNELSGVFPESLYGSFIAVLQIQGNHFTFDGIEQAVQKAQPPDYFGTFTYAPQDTIPLHYNANIFSVSAGGTISNNTYKWYKDGSLIKTIKGDSVFTITEPGKYYVAVTNSIATKLTLYSDTVDAAVLAASLLSFTAIKQPASVLLNWQTASEINTNYFNIQRSSDGIHFIIINKLMAEGNSNSIKNYSYTDDAVKSLNKSILYYRIEEVDKDASGTFSIIRIVNMNDDRTFTISPNPARDFINITSSDNVDNAQVSITNMSGKMLYKATYNFTSNAPLKIRVSQFAGDMFIVTINSTGKHDVFKMLKVN